MSKVFLYNWPKEKHDVLNELSILKHILEWPSFLHYCKIYRKYIIQLKVLKQYRINHYFLRPIILICPSFLYASSSIDRRIMIWRCASVRYSVGPSVPLQSHPQFLMAGYSMNYFAIDAQT